MDGTIPLGPSATRCAPHQDLRSNFALTIPQRDFQQRDGAVLKVHLGSKAKSLSANTVSRLKGEWAKEYDGWRDADLDDEPIVYNWADGVHSGLRGENYKLCAFVIVGVTALGQKRLLAIEDGVREPKQSWREGLLNHKSRGINAPKRAIGDGAMGFCAAMDEVYPETRHQRCWQHKTMNMLNCLPKLSQPKAKAAIHSIWQAETKADAEKAFDLFIETYEPKYPKAGLCLQKDWIELMAFCVQSLEANVIPKVLRPRIHQWFAHAWAEARSIQI